MSPEKPKTPETLLSNISVENHPEAVEAIQKVMRKSIDARGNVTEVEIDPETASLSTEEFNRRSAEKARGMTDPKSGKIFHDPERSGNSPDDGLSIPDPRAETAKENKKSPWSPEGIEEIRKKNQNEEIDGSLSMKEAAWAEGMSREEADPIVAAQEKSNKKYENTANSEVESEKKPEDVERKKERNESSKNRQMLRRAEKEAQANYEEALFKEKKKNNSNGIKRLKNTLFGGVQESNHLRELRESYENVAKRRKRAVKEALTRHTEQYEQAKSKTVEEKIDQIAINDAIKRVQKNLETKKQAVEASKNPKVEKALNAFWRERGVAYKVFVGTALMTPVAGFAGMFIAGGASAYAVKRAGVATFSLLAGGKINEKQRDKAGIETQELKQKLLDDIKNVKNAFENEEELAKAIADFDKLEKVKQKWALKMVGTGLLTGGFAGFALGGGLNQTLSSLDGLGADINATFDNSELGKGIAAIQERDAELASMDIETGETIASPDAADLDAVLDRAQVAVDETRIPVQESSYSVKSGDGGIKAMQDFRAQLRAEYPEGSRPDVVEKILSYENPAEAAKAFGFYNPEADASSMLGKESFVLHPGDTFGINEQGEFVYKSGEVEQTLLSDAGTHTDQSVGEIHKVEGVMQDYSVIPDTPVETPLYEAEQIVNPQYEVPTQQYRDQGYAFYNQTDGRHYYYNHAGFPNGNPYGLDLPNQNYPEGVAPQVTEAVTQSIVSEQAGNTSATEYIQENPQVRVNPEQINQQSFSEEWMNRVAESGAEKVQEAEALLRDFGVTNEAHKDFVTSLSFDSRDSIFRNALANEGALLRNILPDGLFPNAAAGDGFGDLSILTGLESDKNAIGFKSGANLFRLDFVPTSTSETGYVPVVSEILEGPNGEMVSQRISDFDATDPNKFLKSLAVVAERIVSRGGLV